MSRVLAVLSGGIVKNTSILSSPTEIQFSLALPSRVSTNPRIYGAQSHGPPLLWMLAVVLVAPGHVHFLWLATRNSGLLASESITRYWKLRKALCLQFAVLL